MGNGGWRVEVLFVGIWLSDKELFFNINGIGILGRSIVVIRFVGMYVVIDVILVVFMVRI